MSRACISGSIILPLVILSVLTACTIFRDKSISETGHMQHRQTEQLAALAFQAQAGRNIEIHYADSGRSSFRVRIIPEGEFSYSADSGFRGKAKSLVISGNAAAWKSGAIAARAVRKVKFDSAGHTRNEYSEQVRVREKRSETRRLHWILPALAGIVLAGGMIVWAIKRAR